MLPNFERIVRIPDWRLTTAEILYRMPDLTLDIAVHCMLGREQRGGDAAISQALLEVQDWMADRFWSLAPDWTERLPTPANRRFRRAVASLDSMVARIIAQRLRGGAGSRPARDADGSPGAGGRRHRPSAGPRRGHDHAPCRPRDLGRGIDLGLASPRREPARRGSDQRRGHGGAWWAPRAGGGGSCRTAVHPGRHPGDHAPVSAGRVVRAAGG